MNNPAAVAICAPIIRVLTPIAWSWRVHRDARSFLEHLDPAAAKRF
jgi:hypothetical protein